MDHVDIMVKDTRLRITELLDLLRREKWFSALEEVEQIKLNVLSLKESEES